MALRRVTTQTHTHTSIHTKMSENNNSMEDECALFLILYTHTYIHKTYIDNLCKSNKCKINCNHSNDTI